jgi:hypothetical protein
MCANLGTILKACRIPQKKSLQWESTCAIKTDGEINMSKLTVAFFAFTFTNTPRNPPLEVSVWEKRKSLMFVKK